jgi:porin
MERETAGGMTKAKRQFLMTIAGIFLIFLGPGLQNALCQTPRDALEQRIEVMEERLEGMEKTDDPEAAGSEIFDKISFGALVAGAYQYQFVDDASGFDDTGRGAFVFQPEIGFALTDADEIFTKFGFAAGNGFNDATVSPFIFAPWAADLEDDVKNIHGRNRDYLLTVWYKHTFTFDKAGTLGITGGLINGTDYLDENAFANDEFTQFMNPVLANASNGFVPSYDLGGAVEWEIGRFTLKGVAMGVGENDDGESYQFYGANLGYTLETKLGEGHYRVNVQGTSKDFNDISGNHLESKRCVILSFDQQLGNILGVWIRFGWQDDEASIQVKELYSGGLDINGSLWRREQDNIGIGYAYLDGGNQELDKAYVFETYVRFLLNDYVALTVDLQYQDNQMKQGDSPSGLVSGVRCVVEF